jgi:hypothetical protein
MSNKAIMAVRFARLWFAVAPKWHIIGDKSIPCVGPMRKNKLILVVGLLLLGLVGWHWWAHRSDRTEIKVLFSLRPIRTGGRPGSGALFPVLFQLDASYRLTSVKAIEVTTNNAAGPEHVLWHLVSTNGSNPIKVFLYGQDIPGMTDYLPGVKAESLATSVQYRLELTAGDLKGNETFHTTVMP